jgi:SpoVK/Ycf46/Vps4 family AAA+-type ATPase
MKTDKVMALPEGIEIPLNTPRPQLQPHPAPAKVIARPGRDSRRPEEKPKPDFEFKVSQEQITVIGMARQKLILHKLLDLPINKSQVFEEAGITKSQGVILYGPPGTGKTFLVKAVAADLKIPFCYVKVGDVLSKYVGESSKKIHSLFVLAKENQPSIMFIDEADVILQSRDGIANEGGNQELKSAVTQMLQETSDIHDDKKACIFMMAATNQPWNIDMAHKRSGRFEYLLYVHGPGFFDRRNLFKLYLKPRTGSASTYFKYGHINYTLLALASMYYSPADIEKICKIAKLNAMERKGEILLTTRSVQKALWSKEGGGSSLDNWYLDMNTKYLPKKKSRIKWFIRNILLFFIRKGPPQQEDKVKFDKADERIYAELISDVRRFINLYLLIKVVRIFGKGLPNYG